MKIKKNGIVCMWKSGQIRFGDLYYCETCNKEVISGLSKGKLNPYPEHERWLSMKKKVKYELNG
jgi:hypothetical protein